MEHIISSNSIHGNYPYAPISDYGINQPLALPRSTNDFGVSRTARSVVSATVERQQVRSLSTIFILFVAEDKYLSVESIKLIKTQLILMWLPGKAFKTFSEAEVVPHC